jgi:DNA-binding MarR family transcriptional regulator
LAVIGREHSDAAVLFHAAVAQRMGLNATDYKTMSALDRLGPMSAGEIAEYTGLATASVTDLIDRLVDKGYARRVRDANDRRKILVEPVEERVVEARRYFRSTERSVAALYERYSTRDLAVIADFLQHNVTRLRRETEKIVRMDES